MTLNNLFFSNGKRQEAVKTLQTVTLGYWLKESFNRSDKVSSLVSKCLLVVVSCACGTDVGSGPCWCVFADLHYENRKCD